MFGDASLRRGGAYDLSAAFLHLALPKSCKLMCDAWVCLLLLLCQAERDRHDRSPTGNEAAPGTSAEPASNEARENDEEGDGSICGICLQGLPGAGQTSLRCSPIPHAFHTSCVEGLCRRSRRCRVEPAARPTVVIDCPFSRQESIIIDISTFERVRAYPAPRRVGGFTPESTDPLLQAVFAKAASSEHHDASRGGRHLPILAAVGGGCAVVSGCGYHYRGLPAHHVHGRRLSTRT